MVSFTAGGASGCTAFPTVAPTPPVPTNLPSSVSPTVFATQTPTSPTVAPTIPIIAYNGGPVMLGTVNIYLIWYGTWTTLKKSIITTYLQTVGGSPWFNTQQTYYQVVSGTTSYCSGAVTLVKAVNDNYSLGKTLTDPDAIIQAHISANDFGAFDNKGIYLILTASDVSCLLCTILKHVLRGT